VPFRFSVGHAELLLGAHQRRCEAALARASTWPACALRADRARPQALSAALRWRTAIEAALEQPSNVSPTHSFQRANLVGPALRRRSASRFPVDAGQRRDPAFAVSAARIGREEGFRAQVSSPAAKRVAVQSCGEVRAPPPWRNCGAAMSYRADVLAGAALAHRRSARHRAVRSIQRQRSCRCPPICSFLRFLI